MTLLAVLKSNGVQTGADRDPTTTRIGFRGRADLMLVLHVQASGEWEEVYYGPFAPVKAASRHSARDNKDMIAISKLRAMKAALNAHKDSSGKKRDFGVSPNFINDRSLASDPASVA